jgi:hypothetical protein
MTPEQFDPAAFLARFREHCEKGARALSISREAQKSRSVRSQRYRVDSIEEKCVPESAAGNAILSNEIKAVPQGTLITHNFAKTKNVEAESGAPYAGMVAALRSRCPDYIPADRWQRAIADTDVFLGRWGSQAQALGWTVRDLWGLHKPPEHPHASYSRLSRYDETGLLWLLEGREVGALTADSAAVRWLGGSITIYCKSQLCRLPNGLP